MDVLGVPKGVVGLMSVSFCKVHNAWIATARYADARDDTDSVTVRKNARSEPDGRAVMDQDFRRESPDSHSPGDVSASSMAKISVSRE